jgi:uncharacterized protein YndB with AHSA1/START domain
MADAKSSFVYVTYIRTTPEELWAALTTSEFMKKYWFGMNFETDWKVGSPWKLIFPRWPDRRYRRNRRARPSATDRTQVAK